GLLGVPLVLGYASPGRMDHHAAILHCSVVVFGAVQRGLSHGSSRTSWALAAALTVGMWLSTEFLVPSGLAAATIAASGLLTRDRRVCTWGAKAYSFAAISLVVVLDAERGSDVLAVEYDKVSIVHLAVM